MQCYNCRIHNYCGKGEGKFGDGAMRIDVKRELPLSVKELNELLYGKQNDEQYSCFVDRRGVSYNAIPQNYTRHSKLGELVKI